MRILERDTMSLKLMFLRLHSVVAHITCLRVSEAISRPEMANRHKLIEVS